jgi:hypothetical protein
MLQIWGARAMAVYTYFSLLLQEKMDGGGEVERMMKVKDRGKS